jgi:hypothetical protein
MKLQQLFGAINLKLKSGHTETEGECRQLKRRSRILLESHACSGFGTLNKL